MAIPDTNPGRDLGRRILASLRNYVARANADRDARMESLRLAFENTPTLDIMRGEIEAFYATLPAQKQITVEDVQAMLQGVLKGEVSQWALDFERRAQASLERAIDRLPRPEDGRDGEDGGSVEDFDISVDGRTLTVAMKIGERIQQRQVRLDIPLYRDVYQSGKEYERGDMVTYAGSVFVAVRDVTGKEKPEQSPAWKLAVKRGKDAKDSD